MENLKKNHLKLEFEESFPIGIIHSDIN